MADVGCHGGFRSDHGNGNGSGFRAPGVRSSPTGKVRNPRSDSRSPTGACHAAGPGTREAPAGPGWGEKWVDAAADRVGRSGYCRHLHDRRRVGRAVRAAGSVCRPRIVTDEEFTQRAAQVQRQNEADSEEFVAPRAATAAPEGAGGTGPPQSLARARQAVAPHLDRRRSGGWADPVLNDAARQRSTTPSTPERRGGGRSTARGDGSITIAASRAASRTSSSRRFTTTPRRSCRGRATWRSATR